MLAVVFAVVGAYLMWRARPQPLPWHPVGAEKMVTPAFDIADERTRRDWFRLIGGAAWGFFPSDLGVRCGTDGTVAEEIYVLTRALPAPGTGAQARRITIRLGAGGEAEVLEATQPTPPFARHWRAFDDAEAEHFRSIILDGGYLSMTTRSEPSRCDGEFLSLESCVHGRYFAVVRDCETTEMPPLHPLAKRIEAFAAGADLP